jgi:hypothetical protein
VDSLCFTNEVELFVSFCSSYNNAIKMETIPISSRQWAGNCLLLLFVVVRTEIL